MSGKGAKGFIMGKTPKDKEKDTKKKAISRSSRAGLQVSQTFLINLCLCIMCSRFYDLSEISVR